MSRAREEVLAANAAYASRFGNRAALAKPPARGIAILTCMDARIDPAGFAGLAEGDAHVIRNAGGRASDDAIRSLVISYKLLGTREWFVVQHNDCGMETVTNAVMQSLLASSLKPASFGPEGWTDPGGGGATEAESIDWMTIGDLRESVIADVGRIRSHPLVPPEIAVHGFVYDVRSGRLEPVDVP